MIEIIGYIFYAYSRLGCALVELKLRRPVFKAGLKYSSTSQLTELWK
jgi:hypothetical protein